MRNLTVNQMDMKIVFLNGDIDEKIYIEQPEGFVIPGQERKVYKLVKSLYGIKQAPMKWHEKIDEIVLANGFNIGECDSCVYYKENEKSYVKENDSGYVMMTLATVSWKSSKQTVITHSMMKVEFVALDKCAEEVEYLRQFLEDIPRCPKPVTVIGIHCDSDWFRSMKIALSSKLKLGFVDGTYTKPATTATNANLILHWTRCNDIVISWILNIVSPEIRQSVMYMNNAKDIWDDFAIRFAQTNVPKLFNLRKELAYLSQENLSISAYFAKFRSLHDELDAISTVPRCDYGKCLCNVNAKLDNFSKSAKLSQFLMGLGEQYTAIRGHLILMTSIPSLSDAYSLLMQEENQRELGINTNVTESVALSVKTYDKSYDNQRGGLKSGRQSNVKKPENAEICDFCQMSGHSRDKCFCVHSYPPWHRLHGKPKPKPKHQVKASHAYNVNTTPSESVTAVKAPDTARFTNAQCQQLMTMIQSSFKELSATNSNVASTSGMNSQWPTSNTSTPHMAGNVIHFVCHTKSKHTLKSNMWIIDSGATDHITPHFHLLQDVHTTNSVLHLPNGQYTAVTYIGNVALHTNIVLTDMLYVPSFNYNLLSIPKLTAINSCNVFFTKDACYVQDHVLKKITEIGELHDGLYLLHHPVNSSESLPDVIHSQLDHTTLVQSMCNNVQNVTVSKLLHARLGHPSVSFMKFLPTIMYNHSVMFTECDTCHLAKQTRLSFSDSITSSSSLFELIHVDVWGPCKYKTHGNCSYFFTIVEDLSRTTRVFLLPDKSQVYLLLRNHITYIHKQFSCHIKCLRTDNGTEFLHSDFRNYLASLGIIQQKSCTYTPQ
ncbi:uncharacterized protein LOC141712832 [Apium graveolens]|uniref:uncharacterized protein LOC141712832 n=1 Tax=Apium graveolens TaxID=4045 RepID=UPI003D79698D